MKPSTKAKKLQTKLAYFILSGRKMPEGIIISRDWASPKKIWHLQGAQKEEVRMPHCTSCRCVPRGGRRSIFVTSLCKTLSYDQRNYPYSFHSRVSEADLQGRRPCKRCLASLSKVANSDG